MNVRSKIVIMGCTVAVVPTIALILLTTSQGKQLTRELSKELDAQMKHQLEVIATDMFALCKSQQESIEMAMEANLNVAWHILKQKGNITLSNESASWDAVNQITQAKQSVSLPLVSVGDTKIEKNTDPDSFTPIVDETVKLVGGTCTIFQRMNQEGDMLRIATNVLNKEKKRAIGTFIPAINSDGSRNPVIAEVMKGKRYTGKAFVVTDWYITSYEPIKDANGGIIGMLYVGIKQENVASLRKAILATKIGKSGYVFVLRGTGAQKGEYVISKDGSRDGENIWHAKDSDGNLFIQSMINESIKLRGKPFHIRYPWKNQGETQARDKVVATIYFEPWDWVIGASAYQEDLVETQNWVQRTILKLIQGTFVIGMVILCIAVIYAFLVSTGIVVPISKIIKTLGDTSHQTASATNQISSASQ